MDLSAIRGEIELMRRQILRQRNEIRDLQRAGISTRSAEELLSRMLAKVDGLCGERDRLIGEQRVVERTSAMSVTGRYCCKSFSPIRTPADWVAFRQYRIIQLSRAGARPNGEAQKIDAQATSGPQSAEDV
jgi:hypothetical protein